MYSNSFVDNNVNYKMFFLNRGNVDGNDDIDKIDLEILRNYVQYQGGIPSENLPQADINGDGAVDGLDVQDLSIYLNKAFDYATTVSPQEITLKNNNNKNVSVKAYRINGLSGTSGKALMITGARIAKKNDIIDWTAEDLSTQFKVLSAGKNYSSIVLSENGKIFIKTVY